MNAIRRHLGLMVSGAIVAASVWACTATRQADGSVEFRFAPDMAITAFGLEDALGKLTDLLNDCMAGTFSRPCTDAERKDIKQVIGKVLRKKRMLAGNETPSPVDLGG